MIAGLRAGWRGIRHLNRAGYVYIWCNVAWALLTLLVITAPAAWAGMVRLSWTAQRQPTAGWDDFWAGFKEHLGRGVLLAFANVIFFGIAITNWLVYAPAEGELYTVLRVLWAFSIVAVVTLELALFPLYYAMAEPTLIGALRNAAVMIVRNPFFTIGLMLAVSVVVAFSTLLPLAWLLITGGALASIMTAGVIDRLRFAGVLPAEEPVSYLVDPHFGDTTL